MRNFHKTEQVKKKKGIYVLFDTLIATLMSWKQKS